MVKAQKRGSGNAVSADSYRKQLTGVIAKLGDAELLRLCAAAKEPPAFVSPGPPPPRKDGTGETTVAKREEETDIVPDSWWHGFAVHPRGSARVVGRAADYMTPDQWRLAVELLHEGYVLGFNADDDEGPDLACSLARRCKGFGISALIEKEGNCVVYFVRDDAPDRAALKDKKE